MLEGEVRGRGVGLRAVGGRGEFLDPAARPADERLRAHDRDVAAAERRQDHGQQTHVVEHRQPGDAARVAVDLDGVGDLQDVRGHRLVGDLHARGDAGRTGRVLQVRDGVLVVVLARDWGDPARTHRIGHRVDGDDARALLGRQRREEVADRLGGLGGGEDRGRLAVVEDGVQTVGVAGLVGREQRHRDVAGIQGGEEPDHVLERLRREDRNTVTGLGDLLQACGNSAQALAELRPGQVLCFAVALAAVVDETVSERVGLLTYVLLDVVDKRCFLGERDVPRLIEKVFEFSLQHSLLLWPPRGLPHASAVPR